MSRYTILLHQQTFDQIAQYTNTLNTNRSSVGRYVKKRLLDRSQETLTPEALLSTLLNTKRPQIFAESAVIGNGSDWSALELSLLGNISIATPVTVFDNGRHVQPVVFEQPFDATLLFCPGALLLNMHGQTPADWFAITTQNRFDSEKYYRFYQQRLWPLFAFANAQAAARDQQALLTIPGLGCGAFSGPFRDQLGTHLQRVLIRFLEEYGQALPHIKAVYFDPYNQCTNERFCFHGIHLLVRPLLQGNEDKSQLCPPTAFAESGDDFSNCVLFSLVAWDHVSWPGNDFYIGSRATDDGVKAAATNVMEVMTGISGTYNATIQQYMPPERYKYWLDVVLEHKLEINVERNVQIFQEIVP